MLPTKIPTSTATATTIPTIQVPTVTVIVATALPQPIIVPTLKPTVIVQRVIPEPSATSYIPSNTIVCKDGYVWPSPVRQGACHGHGGIRK